MSAKGKKDYLSIYCQAVFFCLLVYVVVGVGYLFFVRTAQLNRATKAQSRLLSLVKEQSSSKPDLTSEKFRGEVNAIFTDYQQLLQVVSFRDEASEKILNRFRRAGYDDSQLDVPALRRSVLYSSKWDYVNLSRSNRVLSIESTYYVLPQDLIYQTVRLGFFLCTFFFLLTVLLLLFYPSRHHALFRRGEALKSDEEASPLQPLPPYESKFVPSEGGPDTVEQTRDGARFDLEGAEGNDDESWLENAFNFEELSDRAPMTSEDQESSELDRESSHEEWGLDFSQPFESDQPPKAPSQDRPLSEESFWDSEKIGAADASFEEGLPLPEEDFDLPELPPTPASPTEDDVAPDSAEEEDFFSPSEEMNNFEETDFADLSEQTTDELFDFLSDTDPLTENNADNAPEMRESTLPQDEDWGFASETPTEEEQNEGLAEQPTDDIFPQPMEEPSVDANEVEAKADGEEGDLFDLELSDDVPDFSPDSLPVTNVDEANFSESFETQLPPVDREPELSELFDRNEEGDPQFDGADDVWESVLAEHSPQWTLRLSTLLDQKQPFSLALLTSTASLNDVLERSFADNVLLQSGDRQAALIFPGLVLPQALEEMQSFANDNTVSGLRCGLSGYVPTRVGLDAETLLEEARYAWLSADAEKPIGAYSGV